MMKNVLLLPLLSLLASSAMARSKAKHHDDDEDDDATSHSLLPTAEDLRVVGLEDIEPAFQSFPGDMFAGLVPARNDIDEKDDASLFFWLFANATSSLSSSSSSSSSTTSDSLVIWFNGGPGCSSLDAGLLFEMGPITTPLHRAGYDNSKEGNTAPLQYNAYSWSHASDIMYVEQPVGVGFSNGDPAPQNEDEVAADFYQFLQNFYTIFPEMRQKRLYLIGESYAGMYVPSMAHYIAQQNQQQQDIDNENDDDSQKVPLAGIALGNGWVDAVTQGPMVIDYAWWHGMIDTVARDALWNVWEDCIRNKHMSEPFHDFTVPDECAIQTAVLVAAGADPDGTQSPNTYDVTTWDKYAVLTSDDGTFSQFYNNPKVKEALNVGHVKKQWMGCLPGAGRRRLNLKRAPLQQQGQRHLGPLLDNDAPVSMAGYITDLLDQANIDVLIYNGDDDLSTCSQGSETFLNDMKWSGQQRWLDPASYERGLWKVDGKVAGHAKSVKNLHFLIVYNSGHMVPYNQPVNALDLVTRLTSESPTNYVDQKIDVSFLNDYFPSSSSTAALSSSASEYFHAKHNNGAWKSNLASGLVGLLVGIIIMWVKSSMGSKRRGYDRV